MRSGVKAGIVGGVFAVVAGGVGWGAYNVYTGLTDTGDASGGVSVSAPSHTPTPIKTGPPSAAEVEKTAAAFLKGWANDEDALDVGQLTNAADEAEATITDFRDEAGITKTVITPGRPEGATVPFTVKATVSFAGKSKLWTYSSKLTVVRGQTTGLPLVDWSPSVIYPKLTRSTMLVTSQSSAPPVEAVDRHGTALDPARYPSLGPILEALREKYGAQAGGSPDVSLRIEDNPEAPSDDDAGTPQTLLTLSKGRAGKVPTTLDANVQAAAEKAVKRFTNASVVAVQPSTGDILAIANNRTDGFDAAMLGQQAPGSTMKLVTSSLLIQKGLATPAGSMPCPPTVTYMGRTFHNEDGFSLRGGSTMTDAFAQSCNTAFIKLIDDTKDDSALSEEAREVFDVGNNNWKTGVVSFDGSVPPAVGGEAAAQYIGQGTVQMDPLDMASITATIKNGSFHQPVLVPQSYDHRQLSTAERPLPASVAQSVADMMRVTARSGTAAQAMAGLGGDKGAKTGSAEVDGVATSNSWFTGFQDDCAATAVVQAGGHGADAAGPVVAEVLAAD